MSVDPQSQTQSEIELISEAESTESIRREASRLEQEFSKYLQEEYHPVIFSDLNYINPELLEKVRQLRKKLSQEIELQTDLAQEVRDAEFRIAELDSKISGLRKTQQSIRLVHESEGVKAKEAAMRASATQKAQEQQEIRLLAKLDNLKAEVSKKKNSEQAVISYLNRAIRTEQEAILEWEERITELKSRMIIQEEMGGLPEMEFQQQREAQSKLEEDRRAGLKLSIQKLKEYITQNQHYLN